MASLSRSKKVNYVILCGCDSCGEIHPVRFSSLDEFMELRCKNTYEPIYSTVKSRRKVWKEFQHDLMQDAVAV